MKSWDKLTEEEREKYINQDWVDLKEFLPNDPVVDSNKSPWEFDNVRKIKGNKILVYELHWLDGKDVSNITYHLPISKLHIQNIIRVIKKNIENYSHMYKDLMREHLVEYKDLNSLCRKYKYDNGSVIMTIYKYIHGVSTH